MRMLLLLLLASAGAGAQVSLQDAHTSASLRGIAVAGPGIAWASGTGGTVLRTEDGGYLWQACTVPLGAEALDFRAVQAFDAQTALVMSAGTGAASRVFKTTDGCQSWHEVLHNLDAEGFFDAMRFSDRRHGWLVGDPVAGRFALFTTADGGEHWRRLPGCAARPGEALFAASNGSLLLADGTARLLTGGVGGSRLLAVADCSAEELPFAHGASAGGFAVAADGHGTVVAVGGDYRLPDAAQGTAAYSRDGGRTWTLASQPPHGYRSGVVYDPERRAWFAVATSGMDVSRDGGASWQAVDAGAWNAMAGPYGVGPKGRIGKLSVAR